MRTAFDAVAFRRQVDKAVRMAARVLENDRAPTLLGDVPHSYMDKFLLAERLVNVGIAAELNCMQELMIGMGGGGGGGGGDEQWYVMRGWVAAGNTVSLRLARTERSTLVGTQEREVVVSAGKTKSHGLFGRRKTTSQKTVRYEVDTTWRLENEFEIFAQAGAEGTEPPLRLHGGISRCETTTTSDRGASVPRPAGIRRELWAQGDDGVHRLPSLDLNITWLLENLNADTLRACFTIDRAAVGCRTPRRNVECEAAVSSLRELSEWCGAIERYFFSDRPAMWAPARWRQSLNTTSLFVPVIPLFEAAPEPGPGPGPEPEQELEPGEAQSLPADVHRFLAQQHASLCRKQDELKQAFPPEEGLANSKEEAGLIVGCRHAIDIARATVDSLGYIEELLREQLVAAVGQEIQAADLELFIRWHDSHLFRREFRPLPFCYDVRRGDACPEGTLSFEGPDNVPVCTTVRRVPSEEADPMRCVLHAGTSVVIGGERFVHGLVRTQFEEEGQSQRDSALTFVARARQFSSFMLLVGKIGPGADEFQPEHAIIVQNKVSKQIERRQDKYLPPFIFLG
jgi:hypothetical protein